MQQVKVIHSLARATPDLASICAGHLSAEPQHNGIVHLREYLKACQLPTAFIDAATYFPMKPINPNTTDDDHDLKYLHEAVAFFSDATLYENTSLHKTAEAFVEVWSEVTHNLVSHGCAPGLHPLFVGALNNIEITPEGPYCPEALCSSTGDILADTQINELLNHCNRLQDIPKIELKHKGYGVWKEEILNLGIKAFEHNTAQFQNVENLENLKNNLYQRHRLLHHLFVTRLREKKLQPSDNSVLVSLPLSLGLQPMEKTGLPGSVLAGVWMFIEPKQSEPFRTADLEQIVKAAYIILHSYYQALFLQYFRLVANSREQIKFGWGEPYFEFFNTTSKFYTNVTYKQVEDKHGPFEDDKVNPFLSTEIEKSYLDIVGRSMNNIDTKRCFVHSGRTLLELPDNGKMIYLGHVQVILNKYVEKYGKNGTNTFVFEGSWQHQVNPPIRPACIWLANLLWFHFQYYRNCPDSNPKPLTLSYDPDSKQTKLSVQLSKPDNFFEKLQQQEQGQSNHNMCEALVSLRDMEDKFFYDHIAVCASSRLNGFREFYKFSDNRAKDRRSGRGEWHHPTYWVSWNLGD